MRLRQLYFAKKPVSPHAEKLDDAKLEEIVLCAGHVVAALRIHSKTVAPLGKC